MRAEVRTALAAALLLLFFPGSLRARDDSRGLQVIEDPETTRPDRVVHDVRRVTFEVAEEVLGIAVHFRRPFPEMMFEAVDVFFDCDEDAGTGIGGAELWVRASVGSRFHPNARPPEREGLPPPLERRHVGYATLDSYVPGDGTEEQKVWVWRGEAAPPEIEGATLSFAVPLVLVQRNGRRYNRHVPVRLVVTGSCSESPIPLRHLVTDEGVGIVADGADDDWSGGTRAADPGGELHADAAPLDVTRVQVDHGPEALLVGVWLDRPGFGTPRPPGTSDIVDRDSVTVSVEPLGGEYLGYRRYVLYAHTSRQKGLDYEAVAGEAFVEFRIARPPAQNAFRVIVWSDAIRTDLVPDEGTFRLDLGRGR